MAKPEKQVPTEEKEKNQWYILRINRELYNCYKEVVCENSSFKPPNKEIIFLILEAVGGERAFQKWRIESRVCEKPGCEDRVGTAALQSVHCVVHDQWRGGNENNVI